MKITLLGTGTPKPTPKRAGSSYLVQTRSETFMFDCGPGSHMRMLQSGIAGTDVTQLFITHWHYDHFMDLPDQVLRRWDQGAGNIPELSIYGPTPIKRILHSMFGPRGVFGPDLDARTMIEGAVALYEARGGKKPRRRPQPKVIVVKHGSIVKGRGWTVRVIEVPHAEPHLRSLAYRLDDGKKSFVYTGDLGPSKRIAQFAKGADVMIHMCHCVAGTELNDQYRSGVANHVVAATHAKQAGVKSLVLSHVTEQVDTNGIRERVIREVGEVFEGTVIFGEDLMQIALEPARITKPL